MGYIEAAIKNKRKYYELKANGICTTCKRRNIENELTICEQCRIKSAKSYRKYHPLKRTRQRKWKYQIKK